MQETRYWEEETGEEMKQDVERRVSTPDFKGFAEEILAILWSGYGSIDGDEIEGMAKRHGLIKEVTATEPCCDECNCAKFDDFPQQCNRKAY